MADVRMPPGAICQAHDFRARYVDGIYRAICDRCGHDAGVVDFTGWSAIEGTGTIKRRYAE